MLDSVIASGNERDGFMEAGPVTELMLHNVCIISSNRVTLSYFSRLLCVVINGSRC